MTNCNNCYWKFKYSEKYCAYNDVYSANVTCDNFSPRCEKCESDRAEFVHDDALYCSDCLMTEFNIVKVPFTMYYNDGEHLGDENDSMIDIFEQLDCDVKEV